ncbi:MAG: hypothetical protein JKY37_23470, partial [Nannocystaceae bacterium]|nr:hypothetical protein [Nannocystaceae bacterium]
MNSSRGTQIKASKKRRRRWLSARGRSLQITKSGWLFIGLTLLVGFAAINSGSNLLHAVFGSMLALIIGSGVLSEATVRRVHARRFVNGPIYARTPTPMVVEITGTESRDALAVGVEDREDPTEDNPGQCGPAFAVRVPGGGSLRLSSRVVMPQRGPAKLPDAVVVTRFPFGLFIKRRALPTASEVLVYPHLRPAEQLQLQTPSTGEDDGEKRRARAGEFYGLREYREGDDPR